MATINVLDKDGNIVAVQLPLAPGEAAAAVSKPVVLASDDPLVTAFGAKTDAKDSHSDGTSISFVQIAKQISFSIQAFVAAFGAALTRGAGAADANTQRVTVDTGQLSPLATTAQTMSAGFQLTGLPIDQPAIAIKSNASATGTQSNVASSATAVTVLASNALRLGATIFNDSTQILYLILSATTPTSSVHTIQMSAGAYYEVPFGYRGVVQGIWASANGSARVTELT